MTALASAFSISLRLKRKIAISTLFFASSTAFTSGITPSPGCTKHFTMGLPKSFSSPANSFLAIWHPYCSGPWGSEQNDKYCRTEVVVFAGFDLQRSDVCSAEEGFQRGSERACRSVAGPGGHCHPRYDRRTWRS